jgi:hypothetical protein
VEVGRASCYIFNALRRGETRAIQGVLNTYSRGLVLDYESEGREDNGKKISRVEVSCFFSLSAFKISKGFHHTPRLWERTNEAGREDKKGVPAERGSKYLIEPGAGIVERGLKILIRSLLTLNIFLCDHCFQNAILK